MGVTARGALAGTVETLRSMVAACASFQALVQAASAAAAKARIHCYGVSSEAARPHALIDLLDDAPEASAGGTRVFYSPNGRAFLQLAIPLVWAGTVTAQTSTTVFRDSALIGLDDDFFKGLNCKILSGARKSEVKEISAFSGATGEITLASALTGTPGVAATFRIEPATPEDAFAFFFNTVGDIRDELLAQSGTGGCLALKDVKLMECFRSGEEKQDDDFVWAKYEFGFGV